MPAQHAPASFKLHSAVKIVGLAIFASAYTGINAWALDSSTVFEIDTHAEHSAISPMIYGMNDWFRNDAMAELNYSGARLGGNRLTSYNWENNYSNAGSDYINHSDNNLVNTLPYSEQVISGKGITSFVDFANANHHSSLVTLQMGGYVAANGYGTVAADDYAPSSRWKQVVFKKGSAFTLTPNKYDNYVYMDELLNFLINSYGTAANGGVRAYSLDNEPSLWQNTHSLLHPAKPTVNEIITKGSELAAVIKSMDPHAEVFGPALWGWNGYRNFQDATDWSTYSRTYDWFISAYLGEMKKKSDAANVRLLDYLDVHYYPEVRETGGNRVTDENDQSETLAELRMQSTRSLWDTSYTESSWIAKDIVRGPLYMIPRVQASIQAQYPGTKLAITEYNFGGSKHYSGAIAEADVLGIFGKYGVDAAYFWGSIVDYTAAGFKIYRNYDGNNSTFGDVPVPVSNPNVETFSSYASIDSETGNLHVILINKSASAQTCTLSCADKSIVVNSAHVYAVTAATGTTIQDYGTTDLAGTPSKLLTLEAHSVYHLVIETPQVPQGQLKVENDLGNNQTRLLFRPVNGVHYKLQSSQDLSSWTDTGDSVDGDGLVHLVTKTRNSDKTLFFRYVEN